MPDPKPDTNEAPKRRRYGWWLFFALILLLAAVCVPVWMRNQQQIKLIERIEAAGGLVNTEPVGPEWLRNFLGEERMRGFDEVKFISFIFSADTSRIDELLEEIGALTSLEWLDLQNSKVTDSGLVHLKELINLDNLTLRKTEVTDVGLVHLGELPNLKRLRLSDTVVTDAGLVHLGRLHNLEVLDLRNTQVSDSGIVHLNGLAKLEYLGIQETRVTESAWSELRTALPKCEVVFYNGSTIHVP